MISSLLNSFIVSLLQLERKDRQDHCLNLHKVAFNVGFRAGSAYTRTLPQQQLSDTKLQVTFLSLLWEDIFGPQSGKFLGKPTVRDIEIIFEGAQLPLPSYNLVAQKEAWFSFYSAFVEGCISGAIDSLGLLGDAQITQVDGLQIMLSVSIAAE